MLMWYIIFVVLIISTAACLLYLSSRAVKFNFAAKMAPFNSKRRLLLGFAIIALCFGGLALCLNLMNAVVCLIYFAGFWFISDMLFYLIRRIGKLTFKRYYAGYLAVLLSVSTLLCGWYLDHNVWQTDYTLTTSKQIPSLKIAHFADSHIGTTFNSKGFAKHLQVIHQQNPDLVLITGDFVDDGTSRAEMIASCAALGKLKTKYGVYFAFGNHDKGYHNPAIRGFTGADLINELKKNGVRVLQDETILLVNAFYIIGRNDLSELQRGGSRLSMEELTKNLDKSKFMIVMDHQPADYKNQAASEVDLVLSGHTHGGQLWPLNKVGEWIGANDRTYGYERRLLTDFIVTSGISDWSIKFKTGTKSEFVIIDIKPEYKI